MEAAMPLYGHEMDDEISPLETGLKFAVKMGKEEDFIGKKAMEERGEPKITRIGLKVTGRGIIVSTRMSMLEKRKSDIQQVEHIVRSWDIQSQWHW